MVPPPRTAPTDKKDQIMTTDFIKTAHSVPFGAMGQLGIARLWLRLKAWRQRRRTVGQLDALNDALLRDIGMRRVGIELAALNRPGHLRPDRYI